MPRYKMTTYDIFVPRHAGGAISHVKVRLTVLHDRQEISVKKEPILRAAAECLSGWPCLPDKCAITLSVTDILLHIIQKNIRDVESWRTQHSEEI
jgi:hypothetical protein